MLCFTHQMKMHVCKSIDSHYEQGEDFVPITRKDIKSIALRQDFGANLIKSFETFNLCSLHSDAQIVNSLCKCW
jgi:hypothetical protein